MKTMCPPGYHHIGFVATHALGYTITIKSCFFWYNFYWLDICFSQNLLKINFQ